MFDHVVVLDDVRLRSALLFLRIIIFAFVLLTNFEEGNDLVNFNHIHLELVKSEHLYQQEVLFILLRADVDEGEDSKAIEDESRSENIVVGNLLDVSHHLHSLGVLVLCQEVYERS